VSHPFRTAGVVAIDEADDISIPIAERIGRKAWRLRLKGVRIRSALISAFDWWGFVKLHDARVEGDDMAWPYVTLLTPAGSVSVFPDPDAPSGTVEVLTASAKELLELMQARQDRP
jgi:hypothetical protein